MLHFPLESEEQRKVQSKEHQLVELKRDSPLELLDHQEDQLRNQDAKVEESEQLTDLFQQMVSYKCHFALKLWLTFPENREVRINLSNLAHTVHSGDLRQLFAEFKIRNVSVNFNEHGKPVGTGDVTLPKRHADRLIQKFAGVSLDGKEIKFAIIDSANIANRVKFPEAPRRAPSNGRPAQRAPKRQNVKSGKPTGGAGAQKKLKAKKPKREAQPKKTLEELDAELDVYMSKA